MKHFSWCSFLPFVSWNQSQGCFYFLWQRNESEPPGSCICDPTDILVSRDALVYEQSTGDQSWAEGFPSEWWFIWIPLKKEPEQDLFMFPSSRIANIFHVRSEKASFCYCFLAWLPGMCHDSQMKTHIFSWLKNRHQKKCKFEKKILLKKKQQKGCFS